MNKRLILELINSKSTVLDLYLEPMPDAFKIAPNAEVKIHALSTAEDLSGVFSMAVYDTSLTVYPPREVRDWVVICNGVNLEPE